MNENKASASNGFGPVAINIFKATGYVQGTRERCAICQCIIKPNQKADIFLIYHAVRGKLLGKGINHVTCLLLKEGIRV